MKNLLESWGASIAASIGNGGNMNATPDFGLVNPFMPGAGIQPIDLGGRTFEQSLMNNLIGQVQLGYPGQGLILHGLRGVGKTVLLERFQREASNAGMLTVSLEAEGDGRHELDTLGRQLDALRAALKAATVHDTHLEKVSLGFPLSLSVTFSHDTDESFTREQVESMIIDIVSEIRGTGRGLMFFLDELQEMDDKVLGPLLTLQHTMGQHSLPFHIIGCGLPNLPGHLTKIRSYAERLFRYRSLSYLDDRDTKDVFVQTAARNGRTFTEDALLRLQELSLGYPYFIQAYGAATWSVSADSPLRLEDVERGIPIAHDLLDEGLYNSRWQRANQAGREYLRALARLGHAAQSGDIARFLGKSVKQVSAIRQQLISHGLIFSPAYGELSFTVPGMDDYILRQDPAGEQSYDSDPDLRR